MERLPQQTKEIPVRDIILRMVSSHQGIKGVDLALKVMGEVNPVVFSIEEYWEELHSLIDCKEIVEVIYILPNMTYRVKSMYFPKGTEVYGNYLDFSEESGLLERRSAKASGV
jgi:hypothetical protein